MSVFEFLTGSHESSVLGSSVGLGPVGSVRIGDPVVDVWVGGPTLFTCTRDPTRTVGARILVGVLEVRVSVKGIWIRSLIWDTWVRNVVGIVVQSDPTRVTFVRGLLCSRSEQGRLRPSSG